MPTTVVHFQIRIPPALHEGLSSLAKEHKASLNCARGADPSKSGARSPNRRQCGQEGGGSMRAHRGSTTTSVFTELAMKQA